MYRERQCVEPPEAVEPLERRIKVETWLVDAQHRLQLGGDRSLQCPASRSGSGGSESAAISGRSPLRAIAR
jgi:hypothetical protein